MRAAAFRGVGRLTVMVGKFVRDLVAAAERSERAKPLPPRVRSLGDFWTAHHWPLLLTRRKGTREEYEYRWRFWIEPELGPLGWDELTRPRMAAWVLALRKAHQQRDPARPLLSSSTVRGIFAALSSVVSHAVSLGMLEQNPCEAARMYLPELEPAARNVDRVRVLTLDEARTLITSPVVEARRRVEYATAIYLCLRVGELHGLRWGCVHTDDAPPFVRVERSYDGPTKSGVPRDVPIHPELVPMLQRWRATWEKITGRAPGAGDVVFPNMRGRMQNDNNKTHLASALKRAGLPAIVFHGLRHTGATLYRAAGVRREDVGTVLGHGQTITDLYAPPSLFLLAEEMKRLRVLTAHSSGGGSSANGSGDRGKVDGTGGRAYQQGQENTTMENPVSPNRVNRQDYGKRPASPTRAHAGLFAPVPSATRVQPAQEWKPLFGEEDADCSTTVGIVAWVPLFGEES